MIERIEIEIIKQAHKVHLAHKVLKVYKAHQALQVHKVPQGIQGIQGPPGINGTNGVNGTQGSPGPSTINSTNVYIVVGPTDTAIIGEPVPERVIIEQIPLPLIPTVSSVALCDPGDTVLSGSFVTNGSAIIRSFEPLDTLNGWNATADLLLRAESGSVTADAECFDNPPLRP